MPLHSAVVVHRNQPQRLRATVAALRDQGVARVFVVDNGGTPAPRSDEYDVVGDGSNLGFGPGANVGLRAWLANASGEQWCAVCPHDAIPADGCLDRIRHAVAARPRAGLVCAEFGDETKPVLDPYFGGITLPATPGDDGAWEAAGFPHGTLMAVNRACLEDIGLFEPDYFAYCEEADLAARAKQAGWEVGMVWGALVHNPHQGTPSAAVDYLMLRNSLTLVRRHFGRYNAGIRLLMAVADQFKAHDDDPWFDAAARRRALVDFLLGRMGPPPERIWT